MVIRSIAGNYYAVRRILVIERLLAPHTRLLGEPD
jgi:hypothetical protein